MKLTRIVAVLYVASVTISIIAFTMFIHMIDISEKKWNIASGNIRDQNEKNGNDPGSPYGTLAERIQDVGDVVVNATVTLKNDKPDQKLRSCQIPNPTILYPFCESKVQNLLLNWKGRCYAEENNVDGRDLCSILIYLSEVEKWCPRLPWRQKSLMLKAKQSSVEKTTIRSVNGTLKNYLNDSSEWNNWMGIRVNSMEKDWKRAILSLSKKRDLSNRSKKKILVFVGAFLSTPRVFAQAFKGGPLGELVQWSDVIMSLYLLGHDLTFAKNIKELNRLIPLPDNNGCIHKDATQQFNFDLIFTDISGAKYVESICGPYFSQIRCKLRVLDSFGTEAEFNFRKFNASNSVGKYKSLWGGGNLNLRQFMTMFPHSPDNSFIGFVAGSQQSVLEGRETISKKDKGLVYAKLDTYWESVEENYLDEIHKHVEIHATTKITDLKRKYLPGYVINHGVVDGKTVQSILKESKVFIGLGFPYEGPAPLEAIANGAAFLNPKFSPPLNRYNNKFFYRKPTRRLVTSQNTYAERFIGEPYVYTIDIKNSTEVELVMRKIMKTKLQPYLPYEFTHEGMLERISAQVENLDFCHDSRWPPLQNMVTVHGKPGQSCGEACWDKDLICEPSYWDILNVIIFFKRQGINCEAMKYVEMPMAPSYEKETKNCYFQQQPLLYSCVSSHPSHIRLCPCRKFIKDQVALCEGCW